jgi:hypothetical protein
VKRLGFGAKEVPLVWETLIVSVAGSAIVAAIYGIFIAQREERIRGYLAVKRRGWSRRRYVSAFVGALRGHAAAVDGAVLGLVVLMFPMLIGLYLWYEAGTIGSRFETLQTRQAASTQQLRGGQTPTRESLEEQVQQLQGKIGALGRTVNWIVPLMRALSLLLLAGVYYGLLFWLPLLALRRQFECEVNRFTLRIQGLASKSELAELAMAESAVVDEESLRTFVRAAAAIAARQGVPRLVDRFDLWANG